MTQKIRQVLDAPNLRGEATLPTPNTGIAMDSIAVIPQKVTFTLAGTEISVAAADDFGSVKLCDLPDKNLHLLAVEVDLVVTKAGTTNGIVAATDLDMAIGTAAASNTTLATTMIDVIEKVDINDDALVVDFEAISVGQSTAAFPLQIADGASNSLFINLSPGNITADDSVSLTGTVDLYFVDLGNRAS